jgi:Topoisomerase C-terminal repeat
MSTSTISIIGYHPDTDEAIYAQVRPYGLCIQLGDETINVGSSRKRFFILKGMKQEDIHIDTVISLLSLPRNLGRHPVTGGLIQSDINVFGPYISHHTNTDKIVRSLQTVEDLLEMSLERAIEILPEYKLIQNRESLEINNLAIQQPQIILSDSASLGTVKDWFNSFKTVDEWKKQLSVINWYGKKENFIQTAISRYLTLRGISNEVEMPCDEDGYYRLDIIIPSKNTVVEIKKIIDKDNLWKGISQLNTYAAKTKMTNKILLGLPPKELEKRKQVTELIDSCTAWDLKICLLEICKEDLGLDEIFKLNLENSSNLFVSISRLSERIFEIIYAYIETFADTTDKLLSSPSKQHQFQLI